MILQSVNPLIDTYLLFEEQFFFIGFLKMAIEIIQKTSYSCYARLTKTNQNKKTVKTIFAVFYFGSFNQSFDS